MGTPTAEIHEIWKRFRKKAAPCHLWAKFVGRFHVLQYEMFFPLTLRVRHELRTLPLHDIPEKNSWTFFKFFKFCLLNQDWCPIGWLGLRFQRARGVFHCYDDSWADLASDVGISRCVFSLPPLHLGKLLVSSSWNVKFCACTWEYR